MSADGLLAAFVTGVSAALDEHVMAEPGAALVLERELRAELDACARPDRWANRISRVPGHGRVLTGPRAKGGDIEQPFVDIVAWTFDPFESHTWASMVSMVRDAYRDHARSLRVRLSPSGVRTLERHTTVAGDQHVMAERVDRLQRHPAPLGADRLSLVAITRDDYYERYRQTHDTFRAGEPVLGELVCASSHGSLELARAQGLLFDASVGGEWAGLVAATRGAVAGADGYVMEEEILTRKHRGNGLGPVLQRAFVDRLDGSGGAFLVGTIDVANLASRRTAERVGRREIARYVFV